MDYITIKEPSNCCGCRACADACPQECIEMLNDKEGFVYPKVDITKCVKCGKCKAVCPMLQQQPEKNGSDNIAYAYISDKTEVVKGSSSGGAFSLIMDAVAEKYSDFVIVGAEIDGIEVKHSFATDLSSSERFKKSKYVQSNTEGIYKLVKQKLKEQKFVLFSGTPCQVAALNTYLKNDYENLLTVDIVCHGVPSQSCFSEYVKEIEEKYGEKVVSAEFRHKRNFEEEKPDPRTIKFTFDSGKTINLDMAESEFLYAYYTGLIYRPGCGACRFACASRQGDITLGDYWGVEKVYPQMNSLRGVSLVRFNTGKGKFMIDRFKANGTFEETKWDFACGENHQLTFPAKAHRNRNKFFTLRARGVGFCDNVNICKKPDSFFRKVIRKLGNIFK